MTSSTRTPIAASLRLSSWRSGPRCSRSVDRISVSDQSGSRSRMRAMLRASSVTSARGLLAQAVLDAVGRPRPRRGKPLAGVTVCAGGLRPSYPGPSARSLNRAQAGKPIDAAQIVLLLVIAQTPSPLRSAHADSWVRSSL